MRSTPELERAFARALLDVGAQVPDGVAGKTEPCRVRRFGVYRNNVYASLIDVLAGRFPVVARLVGEDFFRAMARAFVTQAPPRSPVLLYYGEGFPDFVAGFEAARSVPYLADMAALEWARHAAYHAADATPLPLAELAAASAQAGEAVFVLHPSLRLVSSLYPVVTIFELHGADGDPRPTMLDGGGEDALVLRPYFEVELRRLPKGGVAFIQALKDGASLLQASEAAVARTRAFDLASTLAALMGSGAIVGLVKSNGAPMQEGRPQPESALPNN